LANTATMELDALAEQIIRMLAGEPVSPRSFEKPIEVDRPIMQRYVGRYELVPGFIFTVSVDGDKLMVGATAQPTFQVYPRSETEWFYKVVEATLTFQVDAEGKCDAVELFQNGQRLTARRIE
jgi:serine-type D-Ala-D-Ala carboxypeptidase/endopeptidase